MSVYIQSIFSLCSVYKFRAHTDTFTCLRLGRGFKVRTTSSGGPHHTYMNKLISPTVSAFDHIRAGYGVAPIPSFCCSELVKPSLAKVREVEERCASNTGEKQPINTFRMPL